MPFDIYPMAHFTEDRVPISDDDDIYVLTDLAFGFGGMYCDHSPIPFEAFVVERSMTSEIRGSGTHAARAKSLKPSDEVIRSYSRFWECLRSARKVSKV